MHFGDAAQASWIRVLDPTALLGSADQLVPQSDDLSVTGALPLIVIAVAKHVPPPKHVALVASRAGAGRLTSFHFAPAFAVSITAPLADSPVGPFWVGMMHLTELAHDGFNGWASGPGLVECHTTFHVAPASAESMIVELKLPPQSCWHGIPYVTQVWPEQPMSIHSFRAEGGTLTRCHDDATRPVAFEPGRTALALVRAAFAD